MDQHKLRMLVFEKTGIKIDTTDPVFALVALNDAVLSEYIDRHSTVMHEIAGKLDVQANQLLEAGDRYKKLLQHMAEAAATGQVPDISTDLSEILAEEVAATEEQVPPTPAQGMRPWHWIAAACGIAFLSAALTLGGQLAFVRHDAPPAPVTPQPVLAALTAEQMQLIRDGEKYAKMWPKLDAKTQARIEALVQQP